MGVVIHAEDRFLARRKKEEPTVDPVVARLRAIRESMKHDNRGVRQTDEDNRS